MRVGSFHPELSQKPVIVLSLDSGRNWRGKETGELGQVTEQSMGVGGRGCRLENKEIGSRRETRYSPSPTWPGLSCHHESPRSFWSE